MSEGRLELSALCSLSTLPDPLPPRRQTDDPGGNDGESRPMWGGSSSVARRKMRESEEIAPFKKNCFTPAPKKRPYRRATGSSSSKS